MEYLKSQLENVVSMQPKPVSLYDSVFNFIYDNWNSIMIVVIGFFLITVYTVYNQIVLNHKETESVTLKIRKELISQGANLQEGMTSMKSFCENAKSTDELDKKCNKLVGDVCKMTDCCVYAYENNNKKNMCVAGDSSGPTFSTMPDGNELNYDYYYYKNKCYGNCK